MTKQDNDTRKFKINTIFSTIVSANKAGITINEEALICEAQMNFGCSRRTVMEYLKALEGVKRILRKDGEIWTPEAWEAEKILNAARLNPEEEKCQTKTTSKEEEKSIKSAKA